MHKIKGLIVSSRFGWKKSYLHGEMAVTQVLAALGEAPR